MSSKRKRAGNPTLGTLAPDENEDAFIAGVLEATGWAERNRQLLVIIGVALVLLVAGAFYYAGYRRSVVTQAVSALERIQQTIAVGDRQVAKGDLVAYVDRFAGTPFAMEARMLLGQLHLDDGEAAQAAVVLRPAAGALGDPVGLQTAFLLAAAMEEGGSIDEAIALYERIGNSAEMQFQVVDAFADAGRLRAEQGDFAGAQRAYQNAMDELEDDDPGRGVLELRLAEVRQKAAN